MISLKRKRIDTTAERNLVTGLIVSTRFCRELLPIIRKEYLQSDYSKVVLDWADTYFREFEEAPGENIQNIFLTEGEKIDDGIKDAVGTLLSDLSEKFEEKESFNEDYLLEQSTKYIKNRALKLHADKISALIELDQIEEAEREVSSYKHVARMTSSWVNPFEPNYVDNALLKDEEHLLILPGMLGQVIGPMKRKWLVSLMGPMKRGKSWWLLEFAFAALTERLKVVVISLEMDDEEVSIRGYKRLTGRTEDVKRIIYPVFDCWRNQVNACEIGERPDQPALYSREGTKPPFRPESTHQICTHCRSKLPEEFIPEVWYEIVERPFLGVGNLKKSIKAFTNTHGGQNLRVISYPINTANIRDMKRDLELLEYTENFIPDVIIIDYADILKPEDSRLQGREAINETWKEMRSLAQTRSCLVVTATQANRKSMDSLNVRATHASEDIRKIAHVNLMGVLNQTATEKRYGIMRFGIISHRHEHFDELTQVKILQQLEIGQPFLDSEIIRSPRETDEEDE